VHPRDGLDFGEFAAFTRGPAGEGDLETRPQYDVEEVQAIPLGGVAEGLQRPRADDPIEDDVVATRAYPQAASAITPSTTSFCRAASGRYGATNPVRIQP
jgi:hypothetical protein